MGIYINTIHRFRSVHHDTDIQYADTGFDLLYRSNGAVTEEGHLRELYQRGKGRYEDGCRHRADPDRTDDRSGRSSGIGVSGVCGRADRARDHADFQ